MLKSKYFTLAALMSCNLAYANVEELGNSKDLGLGENAPKSRSAKESARSQDKISNLGHGAYIRQYNDFGKPMVEVHPENGPSYYYNQQEIQAPKEDDGVYDRQTPQWRLGEW